MILVCLFLFRFYLHQHRLPTAVEKDLGLTYHASIADMVKTCDAVLVNCPLHPGKQWLGCLFLNTADLALNLIFYLATFALLFESGTENLFNAKLINSMRRGSYIVNTARGKIMDRDAVVAALKSGQLAGDLNQPSD